MPYSLQCPSPAWEQPGPLFVGQALARLSGPFRPQWPLPEQVLAWLSGPMQPQWPLSEQALVSLPEHAPESLPERVLVSLRVQAPA